MESADGGRAAVRSSLGSPLMSPSRNGIAVSTWSRSTLLAAYCGLYLLAYITSLETQVTLNVTAFATSAFKAHSMLSTVFVVQAVVFSVAKPVMAKVALVFGRFEAFTLSVLLLILGYIAQASSGSIGTYTVSSIFYSAGATGLQILQQIFIADTSSLQNRAVLSTIPDIPFVINVWIGAPLASLILNGPGWRWGYGIWAVVLPISYMPLAFSLLAEKRKLQTLLPYEPAGGRTNAQTVQRLWHELDVVGLLLLSTAISLITIPLTLVKNAQEDRGMGKIIVLLIMGMLSLLAFSHWERNPRLAPHPFFPPRLLKKKSVLAGFAIPFFFTVAYYLSVFPYFQSYLLVVRDESITTAGQIVQIYVFVSTITAIIVSSLIKFTHRYKHFIVSGACVYTLGSVLTAMYRTQVSSGGTIIFCQIAIGVGGGLMVVPTQLGVQAAVDRGEVAATTALFLTALEIGGAVGSSISGVIWANNVLPKLQQYLPVDTKGQASVIFGNITLASTQWPIGDPTREAINRAYQETMTKMLIVAVCACLPLVPLSMMMKNHKLDEMDRDPKDADHEHGEIEEMVPLASLDRTSAALYDENEAR